MNEFLSAAIALTVGIFLGSIFFGGLWWTVRKGATSPQPALWFFGSLLLRMTVTMTGFYLIGGHHWERWLLCLAGFVMARFAVMWLTRAPIKDCQQLETESNHAS